MAVAKKRTSPQAVEAPAGIRLSASQLRSANLERDLTTDEFPSLHLGVRMIDCLERLTTALADPSRTRAWSLTGAYGSGKSTLASLITALLGPKSSRWQSASAQLKSGAAHLAEAFDAWREDLEERYGHGTGERGMLLAVVSARQEPLATTIRRALQNAVDLYWPQARDVPPDVNRALKAFNQPAAGSGDILAAVEVLSAHAPLLLIIDEFGKSLEYLSRRGELPETAADLYLLQELAERGAGKHGLDVYIYTLQHLSFVDYAAGASSLQAREWAKIQGRFEDIIFTPEIGDAVELLRRCLDHSKVNADGRALLTSYEHACADAWGQLGLDGILTPDETLFADLYPLHPVTAIAAPLLAAQVGQHDRTLTSFLAGDEPNSVARFLANHATPKAAHAGTVRLSQVYDYFLASGRTTILASANASRWIEIDTQLAEAHGLPEQDLWVLKTVALLNLIDSAGALRASEAMICFAMADPTSPLSGDEQQTLVKILASLVDRGFLVYREFSDEYRVWRGTDIDIKARIEEIWERADDNEPAMTAVARHLPQAVVAGRHTQVTGMLRFFETLATDEHAETITGPGRQDIADGLLVFHLGNEENVPKIRSSQPVAVGTSTSANAVLEAARYTYALETLLDNAEIQADSVAKREVSERLSQARAELAVRVNEAFSPALPDSSWHLYQPGDDGDRPIELGGRSYAAIVSGACERLYPHAPFIRNEMLGRDTLTSQGAKARRELLTAMIEHPAEQNLGIAGFGPERAMYHGVLEFLGLHKMNTEATGLEGGELIGFAFSEPDETSSLHHAWQAMTQALTSAEERTPLAKIAAILAAPPFGIKDGVIPILLVTALLLHSDDVALFRDGTYQTRLTTETAELLQSNLSLFTVKSAPTASGQSRLVLNLLADHLLSSRPRASKATRNPAVLRVTQALLDHVRVLTPYAQRTSRISANAQAVRTALKATQDPIGLIYSELPVALGAQPITNSTRANRKEAEAFVGVLIDSLLEIRSAQEQLQAFAVDSIADAFRLPHGLDELRRGLAAHMAGFDQDALEASLRGFVAIATNTALPDDDWLDPLAVRISGTAMANWTDAHAATFPRQAKQFADALDRVSHLYNAAQEKTATGAIPVQAQLLTLTDSAGQETRTLVRMPADAKAKAADLARDVLQRALSELGPDGGRILLAALAQELMEMSDGRATLEDSRA